jgi:hypothetical protein
MKRASEFILLLGITALMAGCKLAVIVVEGGEVQSTGSGTCVASAICIVDVNDANFSETFTAVPYTDWYFHKWNSGDRLFCGGSTDSTCTLSFQGHEESKAVEDMIASAETFYLMPVFKPYKDIITVGGKEWLQPNLFTKPSWNDINAVCPAGVCRGELNGIDMTGWTWASVDDVNALFNYYIGTEELGPGPGGFTEADSDWAPAFFSDGWLRTNMGEQPYLKAVEGWTRSMHDDQNSYYAHILYVLGPADEHYDLDRLLVQEDDIVHKIHGRGGWFYRTP